MKKTRMPQRLLALVLVLMMLISVLPVSAMAAELTPADAQTGLTATDVTNELTDSDRLSIFEENMDPSKVSKSDVPADDEMVRVIVQLDADSLLDARNRTNAGMSMLDFQQTAAAKAQLEEIADVQLSVMNAMESQSIPSSFTFSYTSVISGFAAQVPYGRINDIKKLDGVVDVVLCQTYYTDSMGSATLGQALTAAEVAAYSNNTQYQGEGTLIGILDTGLDVNHEAFANAPAVQKLQKSSLSKLLYQISQGEDGKTKVTAYSYAALWYAQKHSSSSLELLTEDDLYKSAKVPFAFDYADADADVVPSADAVEKYGNDHGTHVAGIAAGKTVDADGNVTFAGQSPEAQLAIFKVFSDSTNGASTDTILAALNDALLLDVDVINMSLGSNGGFGREAEGDLTTKYYDLVKASGILLNCSAGNSYSSSQGGAHGDFTSVSDPDTGIISSSSSYDAALSVASVNANETAAFLIGEGRVPYNDVSGHSFTQLLLGNETSKTYEYVMVPNNGDVADYQGLDVTGKIAVVMRGGLSFEQKQLNAAAAGAAGCVIYNNRDGYLLNMSVENYKIPTVCISLSNGQMMADETEKKLTVSSTEKGYVAMSDFSSWGPLPSLSLKPEITAPGGNIYSSLPFAQYGYMSGTSMASPYLAGVAAAALEYVNTLMPGASDTDKQILVNRLLMSTANVLYDEEGVAYSPRKQGSGMVNLAAATTTPAYLYVRGQEKTKIELGDDADQLGVYKLSFVVKNLTGSALSYDVNTQVQTESTTTDGLYIAQKGYALSADTSAIKVSGGSLSGTTVTVPAKGETTVTVTVRLSDADREYLAKFPNGIYVEGFVELTNNDDPALSVPFLGFYGDWTKAPIMDSTDYWETLDGSASQAQAYMNTAFSSSSENTVDTYLGDNNYTSVPYLADRNAISPNNDDFMDSLTGIYTGLLRNTKSLKYTITGANGQVYYSKDCEYVGKSIYSYDYYRIVPAGVDAEYDGIEPWYGTDAHNAKLPNNTKATVTIEATLPYGDGVGTNQKSSWSFPITIDTEEPHADNLKVTESEGRYYLSLDVSDNQYVAAVVFYNIKNSEMLYGMQGFGEDKPGVTSHVSEYDITGFGETFGMIVHDYAGNSKVYTVRAPGNPDDHGTITPTNILWTENFNEKWLPDDWSIQSKGSSLNTWYRDEDYTATVDYDDDNQQNEWLISRTTDISGVDTEVHMVFDFYTTYWHTVEYKHCNLQVMASGDGGATWQEIWNLQRDSGLFTAWTKTQAKVNVPESLQNSKDLRFAFVYTGKGGSNLSLDNVQLYAEERDNYVAVTASAGEGGAIDPAGQTLVKKGTSKTFTVTPAQGYEIANVTVDGTDLGPISYYTFQRVGVDHTISATFQKAQPSGDTVTLTTTASDGGTVAPAGQTTYVSGQAVDVTFTPDQGYQLASVKVNGRTASVTGNVLTLTMDQSYAVSAVFEKIPDVPTVMFENDFESVTGDSFPFHGWTLKGVNPNGYTWKQDTYYNWKSLGNDTKHAYISDDWHGGPQDEWLISPSVNLSGTRDGVLYFDYAYGIYGIKNKTFTATVEASTDGGQTWTPIWNFQDSYTGQETSGYALAGSAEVKVPAQYAVDGVQFAFRYVNTTHDTAPPGGG